MKSKLYLFVVSLLVFTYSSIHPMENEETKGKNLTEALGSAIMTGNVQGVREALEQGADPNGTCDTKYSSGSSRPLPFLSAALNKEKELYSIVQLLIKHGADIHLPDEKEDKTPLDFAAHRGHLECQRLLISHGAEINHENKYGYTPLKHALDNNKRDCYPTDFEGRLFYFTKYLNYQTFSVLLTAGASPNKLIPEAALSHKLWFFDNLIFTVPVKDIIKEKQKAAVALLLCFKRFEFGDPLKVIIPKNIQLMLCDYCVPHMVDVETVVKNRVITLKECFKKVDLEKIKELRDSAYAAQDCPCCGEGHTYSAIIDLNSVENIKKYRPLIKQNVVTLLQEVAVWSN